MTLCSAAVQTGSYRDVRGPTPTLLSQRRTRVRRNVKCETYVPKILPKFHDELFENENCHNYRTDPFAFYVGLTPLPFRTGPLLPLHDPFARPVAEQPSWGGFQVIDNRQSREERFNAQYAADLTDRGEQSIHVPHFDRGNGAFNQWASDCLNSRAVLRPDDTHVTMGRLRLSIIVNLNHKLLKARHSVFPSALECGDVSW